MPANNCCQRTYQLLYRTPTGDTLNLITDAFKIDWVLKLNKPGLLTLELPCASCSPDGTGYSLSDFGQDYRFELWRDCCGEKKLVGDSPFFLTAMRKRVEEDGSCSIHIEAETALGLLDRRINAYDADRPESDLAERPADDQMKYVVRNNFGPTATSHVAGYGPDGLRLPISSWLTVEPNESAVAYQFGGDVENDTVLSILENIAEASFAAGEPLFYDVVQISEYGQPAFEFRTWTGQRGVDRTVATGAAADQVVLTEQRGICAYEAAFDWSETVNRSIAGGEGSGNARIYAQAVDPDLAALLATDPFALREAFLSGKADNVQALTDEARAELSTTGAGYSVDGLVCDAPGVNYCEDYGFGDKVSVFVDGIMTSTWVETESGTIENGSESLDARFSTELNSKLGGIAGILQQLQDYQRRLDYLQTVER